MKHFEIIERIEEELQRAKRKHPAFPQDRVHQVSIVAEECGEAIRAANQFNFEEGSINELAKELIQTAAMCFRMLENIEAINLKDTNSQN